ACDITKQTTTAQHQHREALDQTHDDLAANDDDRDADDESEYDQRHVALGCGGYRHDVVETHDQVRDDNRPHGREQAITRLHLVFAAVVLRDQLDADPDEQRSSHKLEL